MRALGEASIPPSRAGSIAEQFHTTKVTPGDLLVVDKRGGAMITAAAFYKPGPTAQVVLDIFRKTNCQAHRFHRPPCSRSGRCRDG